MNEDSFFQSNKITAPIEYFAQDCDTFEEFEARFSKLLDEDCRVSRYLGGLLIKYDKRASFVSEQSDLSTSYVGHIVNGKRNNPSRDVLIRICFAIGTTVDEVQRLLKYAGHSPLYVKNRRDVIIWFGFVKAQGLDTVNDYLYERGFPLLEK